MRYYVNMIMIVIAACSTLSDLAHASSPLPIRIVMVGDSITAGAQLTKETALTARLEQKLLSEGYNVEMIDFTSPTQVSTEAHARLDEIMALEPDIVLLQMGFNDALRGLDLTKNLYTSLYQMTGLLAKKNIGIVLLGTKTPDHTGKKAAHTLDYIYRSVASHRMTFYPDILDSLEGRPDLTLADGFHPNGNGVLAMVQSIYPYIEPLVVWRINLQIHEFESR